MQKEAIWIVANFTSGGSADQVCSLFNARFVVSEFCIQLASAMRKKSIEFISLGVHSCWKCSKSRKLALFKNLAGKAGNHSFFTCSGWKSWNFIFRHYSN